MSVSIGSQGRRRVSRYPPPPPPAQGRAAEGRVSATGSGRMDHLAAGLLDRTRGLDARDRCLDGVHVLRAGLGRMCLANEDRGHELVIALAVDHLKWAQPHIRWQL